MVLSFGSINMDLVVQCDRVPDAGETVWANAWFMNPGGKGANQAVQAARLGAATAFIGCVGADAFGRELADRLHQEGIDRTGVRINEATSSGLAYILVERTGENRIVAVSGANGSVGEIEIRTLERMLSPDSVLMLQCEVPFPVVLRAAHLAHQHGATVILDPSPVPAIEFRAGIFADIDYVMPNEGEARAITGQTDLQAAGRALLSLGAASVIIKRGAKGALTVGACGARKIKAFSVPTVDTTAAGDSFQGAFAAAVDRKAGVDEALLWATAAGALTVTRQGAQQSMPDRFGLQRFLTEHAGALEHMLAPANSSDRGEDEL